MQPGFLASLAAVVVIGVMTAIELMNLAFVGWPGTDYFVDRFLQFCIQPIGAAIGVAWLGLLVGRRWRSEKGWIDRWGRVLGVIWIGSYLFGEWRDGFTSLEGMAREAGSAAKYPPVPTDLLDPFNESPPPMTREEVEKRLQLGEPSPSSKKP